MRKFAASLLVLSILLTSVGCSKPLRVGTKGADLYHREGCPSVQRSWDKGFKRVNYYTWVGIWLSGRKPDTTVCHAGTFKDPDGLLDSIENCEIESK